MLKILTTSLVMSIVGIFTANWLLDDMVLLNTSPKKIDQYLYQDVTYVLQRCELLKIEDFCQQKFNKITRLEVKEHDDWHFGFNNRTVIGVAWFSYFTPWRQVFISTAISWDETMRRTTMVHELGHVLDLDHLDGHLDIMNSYLNEEINLINLDGYTDLMLMRAYNQSIYP